MNEEWWETPICLLCDYWWVLLSVLVLLLTILTTKNSWLPIFYPPRPTTTPTLLPATVLGSGDVQVTLTWNTMDDLDVHVLDPNGEEVYYKNKITESGGMLDVDSNADCINNITRTPVENIFWPIHSAPYGQYIVSVVYYKYCSIDTNIPFHLRVLVDGRQYKFDDNIQRQNDRKIMLTFSR